jgi:hypothetical protein
VAGAVNAGVNVFNDIEDGRLDERLRRGIKGGEMKARCNGPRAPEARSGAALSDRESVAVRASLGGWRWGTKLTTRAQLLEKRGGGGRLGKA